MTKFFGGVPFLGTGLGWFICFSIKLIASSIVGLFVLPMDIVKFIQMKRNKEF